MGTHLRSSNARVRETGEALSSKSLIPIGERLVQVSEDSRIERRAEANSLLLLIS